MNRLCTLCEEIRQGRCQSLLCFLAEGLGEKEKRLVLFLQALPRHGHQYVSICINSFYESYEGHGTRRKIPDRITDSVFFLHGVINSLCVTITGKRLHT